MEPEGSLPYSQVSAIRPYPEPTPADGTMFGKINKPGTGVIHAPKFRNSGEYTVVSHQTLTPWSTILLRS
jgi:hypothetical protein